MDVLSRMLSLAEDIKLLKGIKISRRAPSISHLFFADDAMFFFKVSPDSCSTIADILFRFGEASGQQVNLSKSYIKFSPSVSPSMAETFKSILRFPTTDSIGNHLGVPIDLIGAKSQHFTYLIERVKKKIISWAHCKLSKGAKLILINSVLIGISSHVLKSFKIPLSIANKLDSLITRFWWAKNGDKGIHWVNRQTIQLPKGMGGLGICSIPVYNDALLFKKVQRMHTNPQLLASKMYNASSESMLCSGKSQTKTPSSFSWVRRNMHKLALKVMKGFVWKIGSGRNILASSSKWVHGQTPVVRSNQNLLQSSKWTVSDLINQTSRSWKVSTVRDRFEWKSAQEILSVDLPEKEEEDFLYWHHHPLGKYTVKSGYAFLAGLLDTSEPSHRNESFDFF
ncbi:uncharacterized protein LOC110731064 [Chenopodium quinoa]|uniref:uncharacterized protein LOC110731064 n=1 Tax=Chenopodium quinoa TaxID=63459 RepID=UPI000B78C3FD|nr:uncharacterized protein LOC110731064 [Chenopodium quinoa]